jgi:hypothetical protein
MRVLPSAMPLLDRRQNLQANLPMKPRFGIEVEIANSFFSGDQRSDLIESLEQPRIILMRVRGLFASAPFDRRAAGQFPSRAIMR